MFYVGIVFTNEVKVNDGGRELGMAESIESIDE
jgi:hypothetical protein